MKIKFKKYEMLEKIILKKIDIKYYNGVLK